MRPSAFLLAALIAAPAAARAQAATAPASPSAVADARGNFQQMSNYVLQSAIEMPEEKYGFKPSPDVRSFGELVAHVAGAQAMFCAMALGEKAPAEDAVVAKTKADLVAAMRTSNAGCARAYGQADAGAMAMIDVFGQQHTRLYALIMNAAHTSEHYGNLVTYLRMNGLVPPSSRPM